jgi:hypothetical protein
MSDIMKFAGLLSILAGLTLWEVDFLQAVAALDDAVHPDDDVRKSVVDEHA